MGTRNVQKQGGTSQQMGGVGQKAAVESSGIGKGEMAVCCNVAENVLQGSENVVIHDFRESRYAFSGLPQAKTAPLGASSNTRLP